MYIINKPRGGGKTYELIMDSAKTGATIICALKEQMYQIELNLTN